uniref:Uncharacterized protein n=1 Tax=Human herpesvirus 2 TaxID=10310 RepID=A0A481T4Y8_HHV2|nr:hypothetical protein [Human alphaherpesvirus 2]
MTQKLGRRGEGGLGAEPMAPTRDGRPGRLPRGGGVESDRSQGDGVGLGVVFPLAHVCICFSSHTPPPQIKTKAKQYQKSCVFLNIGVFLFIHKPSSPPLP